jgi:hypothetical protein
MILAALLAAGLLAVLWSALRLGSDADDRDGRL